MKNFICFLTGLIFISGYIPSAFSADNQLVFENDKIKLQLFPRTPNQMAAFYEARGFPKKMIEVLNGYCFITAGIRNKTRDIFWLDTSNWKIFADTGDIKRIHRKQWPPRWEKMNIPMASQSTFRWTLLPEKLEFYPDEREGGNIILVSTRKSFTLQARFDLGSNKQKGHIMARINNVMCAEDAIEKRKIND